MSKPGSNEKGDIHILKDMKESLGDPKTCRELFDILSTKFTSEEIYNFHKEEQLEAYRLNNHLYNQYDEKDSAQRDEKMAQKEFFFKSMKILKLKNDLEFTVKRLRGYYKLGNIDGMRVIGDEKNEIFKTELKEIYRKTLLGVISIIKGFREEDLDFLRDKVLERMQQVNRIEDSSISALLNLMIKHLWTGEDQITRSLRHVNEISGEVVSRPILAVLGKDNTIENGDLWPSVATGFYCFDQIDFTDRKGYLIQYKKDTDEHILRILENSLPTVVRMMNLAQKAKGLSTQGMMHEELSKELIKRDIQIDIPELQKLEAKRDALEIIINADEVLIKSYLDKLKVIISSDNEHELPEAMKNLLEEQKENA